MTLAKALLRAAFLAVTLAGVTLAAPVSAQLFSPGYQFLKAVKERDGDAVTKLLTTTNGSIVNSRDVASGETALHFATQRRDTLWVRFLTEKGANPNIADKNGVTPLQIASNLGFVDGVEVLLKAGADVDVTSSTGETPLIAAVLRRDHLMARLLLANGANADRADNSGRSAREYAALDGSTRVVDELAKSDASRKGSNTGKSYGPTF